MYNLRRSVAVRLSALAGLSGVLVLCSCGGPTKTGQIARTEARDRMSLVNAQIGFDQAQRAFEVGQFDRALREIGAAIERSPSQPEFHLLQGRILLEEHRLEPAIASFQHAVELAEETDWAADSGQRGALLRMTLAKSHYFSGIVQQRWSNHERSYEQYRRAAEVEPSNVQYVLASAEALIALGRYREAEELIELAQSGGRFEHNAALRQLLGQLALIQDDPRRAVAMLTEARLLSPEDLTLLEELARAQFAAEMFGRCHDSLQALSALRAVQSNAGASPSPAAEKARRADLLHMEARCLVMMDRPGDARRVYVELTELVSGEVEPWIELGAVAYEIGDMRRLSAAAARVAALSPERWEGPFLQAMYELRMAERHGEGDATAGTEPLERAIRLLGLAARQATAGAGASPVPHLVLGRVLEMRGDNDGALAAYAHAKRIDPNDRHARELHGAVSSRASAVSVELESR